jgi:hypothetical protein
MPRTSKRADTQIIILQVLLPSGSPYIVPLGMQTKIVERLRSYEYLQGCSFLYAGYTIQPRDTPTKLRMSLPIPGAQPSSCPTITAVRTGSTSSREDIGGHIRGEGLDVTRFTFVSIHNVDRMIGLSGGETSEDS